MLEVDKGIKEKKENYKPPENKYQKAMER